MLEKPLSKTGDKVVLEALMDKHYEWLPAASLNRTVTV